MKIFILLLLSIATCTLAVPIPGYDAVPSPGKNENYIPSWNYLPVVKTLEEAKACIPYGEEAAVSTQIMGHKKGVQTSLYLIISRKIASKYPDNPWLIRCVSLPNKEILEIDPKYKNWSRYDGHIQCACGGPFGTHPTLKRGFQCEKCEEPFPNGGALASGGTHLASEPDSFFGFGF